MRSPNGNDIGSRNLAAQLDASRAVSINARCAQSELLPPSSPSRLQTPSSAGDNGNGNGNVPFRFAFSAPKDLPHTYSSQTLELPNAIEGGVLEKPPEVYVNEAVGRERMRQAAQEQDFPVQPFLKNIVKYKPEVPTIPQALPTAPGDNPPQLMLPNGAVNGPMSTFGIEQAKNAKNLPQEVMDACLPPSSVDPFYPLMEEAMALHKEQVRALVTENEELKDKLNAVLTAQWHFTGDELHGRVGPDIQPLHLTTEVPEYLKSSWMWTVDDKEHAKQLAKSDSAFVLLSGWAHWQDYSDEAKTVLKGETQGEITRTLTRARSVEILNESLRDPCAVLVQAPDSTQRLVWDLLGMFLLLYDTIVIPLGAFEPEESGFLKAMDWVTLIFWSLDMVASFLTGYVDQGETVMAPGRIARNYMGKWFWIDAIVVIPDWAFTILDMSGVSGAESGQLAGLLRILRAVRVIRLLRLAKLRRLIHKAKDRITSESVFLILFVLQLLILLVFCNHFLGALWYLVGDFAKDEGNKDNWISHDGIDSEPFFYRYLVAFQWSMANFALGSVSIFPRNIAERAFAVSVLIFGIFIFSLMTASITSSMVRLQNINSESENQFWLLRRYLRQNRVSNTLGFKLLRYLEYKVSSTREFIQEDRLTIMNMLPDSLHRQLKCTVTFGPFLSTHPLMTAAAAVSEPAVHVLSDAALTLKHFAAEDTVYGRSTMATHMFWLCSGQLIYRRRGKPEEKLYDNDWACEGSLWTYWATRGDLRSSAESQVITLESSTFVNVLRMNELMLAMMSSYAELYLEWLNSVDTATLTDISYGNRGGMSRARQFVDGISALAKQRVQEDEDAAEKRERKLARKREKDQMREIK